MTIERLTDFFLWCTLINGAMLILWTLSSMFLSDTVYRLHNRWFSMSREQHKILIYGFLGLFKIVYLVFNVTPYIALKIIA